MIELRRYDKDKWEFSWGKTYDAAVEVLDEGWELLRQGDTAGAVKAFEEALTIEPDLIDSYAGLGKLELDRGRPGTALRYYEKGVRIGLKALPVEFDGTLPWGLIENRPFHRCLHGLGLSLMDTGNQIAAQAIFRWGLRLNPDDAIGLRFLVAEWVEAKH